MALKKRRTVMSVNKNIDRRLDRSGMSVDRSVKDFMSAERRAAMSGRVKRKKSFFEIETAGRTLLG